MREVARAPGEGLEVVTVLEDVTDEAFAQAVRSLQRRIRTTYELHVLGATHAEIARRLGIRQATVAARLHEARAQLRVRLAGPASSGEET